MSAQEPATSRTISVEINGEVYERDVDARRLLVHFIRDDLELTGTHIGCDTGNCGACTVQLDGQAVKSCMLLAVQADGAKREDGRGARVGRRRAEPAAAVLLLASRAPVRLLHAGDADERHGAARAEPAPDRGGGADGDPGQHLPLHRLRQHRRGDRRRREARHEHDRDDLGAGRAAEGPHRPVDPAQGGQAARPGPGDLLRRRPPARDGLRPLRPLAARPREDRLDRRRRARSRSTASTGR